jgi:hypothetical protein
MRTNEINIKVVVNKKNEEITVTDDAGNSVSLKSLMVIGGGHESQAFYLFTAGSSSDLGWALGKAWRFSELSKRKEEGHLRKAFNQFVAWVATYKGWNVCGEGINPETLLARWSKEDEERAAKEAAKETIH